MTTKIKHPLLADDKTSLEYLKNFIEKSIDFESMVINSGIYETKSIAKHNGYDGLEDITIGVCFEDVCEYELPNGHTLDKYYYYNVFIEDEYINIFGDAVGSIEERLPKSTLTLIRDTILDYIHVEE